MDIRHNGLLDFLWVRLFVVHFSSTRWDQCNSHLCTQPHTEDTAHKITPRKCLDILFFRQSTKNLQFFSRFWSTKSNSAVTSGEREDNATFKSKVCHFTHKKYVGGKKHFIILNMKLHSGLQTIKKLFDFDS